MHTPFPVRYAIRGPHSMRILQPLQGGQAVCARCAFLSVNISTNQVSWGPDESTYATKHRSIHCPHPRRDRSHSRWRVVVTPPRTSYQYGGPCREAYTPLSDVRYVIRIQGVSYREGTLYAFPPCKYIIYLYAVCVVQGGGYIDSGHCRTNTRGLRCTWRGCCSAVAVAHTHAPCKKRHTCHIHCVCTLQGGGSMYSDICSGNA